MSIGLQSCQSTAAGRSWHNSPAAAWLLIWAGLLGAATLDVSAAAAEVLLVESFENGTLDPRISVETVGGYSSAPAIKSTIQLGSAHAFGFGLSTCGASCFSSYVTNLRVAFSEPTFVSLLSFREMELYDNWGSGGTVYIDGQLLPDGVYASDFGRPPYNDRQADSAYRARRMVVDRTVTEIVLSVGDITNLSEIFIDDLEILSGLSISTSTLGAAALKTPFSQQLEAVLGTPPLTWSVSAGELPAGVTLASEGLLSGTPEQVGSFTVTIAVTDGSAATAERTFTLDVHATLPPPEVKIRKVGSVAVPGRVLSYFILVENVGSVTATTFDVHELLDGEHFSLVSVTPPAAAEVTSFPAQTTIIWNLPELLPGASTVLSYQARLKATVPLGTEVLGQARVVKGENRSRLVQCFSGAALVFGEKAVCNIACGFASACVFGGELLPPCWLNYATCLACYSSWAREQRQDAYDRALSACYEQYAEASAVDRQLAVGPQDPNEKLSLPGKFIRPDQRLWYPIHFENIGDVEAQGVFIRDTLSGNLNLATIEVLTSSGSMVDAPSRTVKWDILGINLLPRASGSVLFSVLPSPGLASGTEIRNSASIQFEIFDTLVTDEVVNIIDDTTPQCLMTALPPEVPTLSFLASWAATDAVGEVEAVSVLVSTDGGPYVSFVEATASRSATFVGEPGRRYDFLCTARDTAGNTEVQAPVAETTTLVRTPVCRSPGKSTIFLENHAQEKKDNLKWAWTKGALTTKGEFGDPTTDTEYNLVIQSAAGTFATLFVPSGTFWKDGGRKGGFKYNDKLGTNSGVTRVALKPGKEAKAAVIIGGKGAGLAMPHVSGLTPPVRVRLENAQSGVCWEAAYENATKVTPSQWKAEVE